MIDALILTLLVIGLGVLLWCLMYLFASWLISYADKHAGDWKK